MTRHSQDSTKRPHTSPGFFARLMLVIFATELAEMRLLSDMLDRLGLFSAALADSALLVLLTAPLIWFVVIRPLTAGNATEGGAPRIAPAGLFIKVLIVIFLVEFLVMLVLPFLLPDTAGETRYLADAYITTLLCGPLLWWLLSLEQRSYIDSQADLLRSPWKLYLSLVCMVFLIDVLDMPLVEFLSSGESPFTRKVIDSFLTTIIVSPFIWWLVIRPLRKFAIYEKTHSEAVRAQVVEAIVVFDEQGTIESINPAAERIFGYSAAEIAGRTAVLLFCDDRQCLDELVRSATEARQGSAAALTHELLCRRRDGSTLTMDVSLSRILVEGKLQFLAIMRDITERKRAEQALQQSLSLLTATLEATADGILVVDNAGHVQTFNEKILDMWRVTRQFVESTHCPQRHALFIEQLQDPQAFVARVEQLYGEPEAMALDILRFKDGRVFERYSHPQLLEGISVGRVWSFRDITARTQAEEVLRESEERFRQLFEQSEDSIIFFKPGTCSIIDLNATTEKLYGCSKAELKEAGLERFSRPEEFARLCSAIIDTRPGEMSYLDNLVNQRKDGTEIIVSMRGKVVTIQGVDIIYCTFRNVTERVRMEEEARNIQAKLIQANKMTSLGLLVSGVAHEINNPNNFIMANSQLLARAWEDAIKILREHHRESGDFLIGGIPFSEIAEHSPKLFEGIVDGARRINEIVNNLKSFARKDRAVTGHDVDVNQVVTAAASILHYQLVRHTENFHLDLAENIPHVKGSSQQLEQVVINLLMNACQALPTKLSGIWVTTGFDAAADRVTITVRDEGGGISRELGHRIMEPFFTTKLDSGGTGLGLSISHAIIRDHDGSLEFESEPGKGTTFIVKIPAGASAGKEPSA